MKIKYADDNLKKLCLEHKAAAKKLRVDSARKLRGRYSDLAAHLNVKGLNIGHSTP
jgi:hypothetical protein